MQTSQNLAKPAPLATERDQAFMMTVDALHPQESVLQPATFEVTGKFLLHMRMQGLALLAITSPNSG